MKTIKRLQNVHVVALDPLALSAFYASVFGLAPKFSDGNRWIQYDIGGSGFALACPGEGIASQAGAVPVLEVSDFEDVAKQVEEAGGTVSGVRDMGSHGRVMTLADPAGNALQLFCRPAGRAS